MNPDIINLIIPFACGIAAGTFAGVHIAGMFASRKLARKERETWSEASKFYRHRYGITE